MRTLEEASGQWQGRWYQPDDFRRGGASTGDERAVIRFSAGVLEGRGQDQDGEFTFRGHYEANKVRFVKAYRDPDWYVAGRLVYEGVWNGTFIGGVWVDTASRANRGPFELWPVDENEGLSLTALYEAERTAEITTTTRGVLS